jgi:hypothetical protein
MITGYTRPLYLLPFDHRASYISGLFDWKVEGLDRQEDCVKIVEMARRKCPICGMSLVPAEERSGSSGQSPQGGHA